MPVLRLALAVVAAWSIAGSARGGCLPEGPGAEAFTTREDADRAAGLLVVSGPLLMMDAYGAKSLRRIKPTCEVARLQNGKLAYVVEGTSNAALPRIMTPNDRKAPLFFLMTVPDLPGDLRKSNEPAKPLGYVLASRDDKVALVFRAYDAIPSDVQLASELGAALEGRIPPMLRADLLTNEVQISVAKGAGAVAERQASPAAVQ